MDDSPYNDAWFKDHYLNGPQQIIDFLGGDGISMQGRRVADVGTGDGIMALGLYHMANPACLVGYDIRPVDVGQLQALAMHHGVGDLPEGLTFETSSSDHIPASGGAFDFVVSWSVFEHVTEPLLMAQEIRRVIAPTGVVFIQLFPFYASEHGDHGWERPSFDHLLTGVDREDVYLNRLTFDGLHDTLTSAGLLVTKVELIHFPFHLPHQLNAERLSDLAIGGVKLTAVPIDTQAERSDA
jgi:SAM-dependent methyltransferase